MGLRSIKRQQMRRAVKESPSLAEQYRRTALNLDAAKKLVNMVQNGITPADVENAYKRGYKEGADAAMSKLEQGAMPYLQVFCGALCLSMHKHYGFSAIRIRRVIAEALETMNNGLWLEPKEVLDEVARVCKLDLFTTLEPGGDPL